MTFKLFKSLIMAVTVLICTACNENNNGVQMHNNANTDIELLRKFIQLPKEPLAVKWQSGNVVAAQNQSVPGPSDWGLVAILEYKPGVISELTALTDTIESNRIVSLPEGFMWDWVKQALASKAKKEKNYYQLDAVARNAEIFARSPLLNGYWVELNDNSILLYLYTR